MTQTQSDSERLELTNRDFRPAVTANGGALTFSDLDSLQRLSKYLLASRMMPKQYDSAEKVGAGIQFAIQVGFRQTWLLALRQIAVINGTPSLFGDLPLALVRASGQLEEFDEWLYDKDHSRICLENKNTTAEFIGAACKVKRKGYPVITKTFTVQDAKTACVWGKNVWLPYPKRMIQMRTRSIALKDEFADILNGMSIGEYDHDTILERVVQSEVTDAPKTGDPSELSGAARLNAMAAQAIAPEVLPADSPVSQEGKPAVDGEFVEFEETRIGGSHDSK